MPATIDQLRKWAARIKSNIELAQLANDGAEFRLDFCTCDPSVGMSPCQYCAIHDALRYSLEFVNQFIEPQPEGETC